MRCDKTPHGISASEARRIKRALLRANAAMHESGACASELIEGFEIVDAATRPSLARRIWTRLTAAMRSATQPSGRAEP